MTIGFLLYYENFWILVKLYKWSGSYKMYDVQSTKFSSLFYMFKHLQFYIVLHFVSTEIRLQIAMQIIKILIKYWNIVWLFYFSIWMNGDGKIWLCDICVMMMICFYQASKCSLGQMFKYADDSLRMCLVCGMRHGRW